MRHCRPRRRHSLWSCPRHSFEGFNTHRSCQERFHRPKQNFASLTRFAFSVSDRILRGSTMCRSCASRLGASQNLKILGFCGLEPRARREGVGIRSQIVSGCVRAACGALARVSALPGLRKPQKSPENTRPAANPLLCLGGPYQADRC